MPYCFDQARLMALAAASRDQYQSALPYPHTVIEQLLIPDTARQLRADFPHPDDDMAWDRFGAIGFEVKRASPHEERFPESIRHAVHDLNSGPFIRFLEHLTGIEHLLPDPHLHGAGIHLSKRGDHLGIHADFNWHEGLRAHRRINLLIYLNDDDWQETWGGELEIWSTDAARKEKSVAPIFNRAVIFNTRSDTFHGHPTPLATPEHTYRRSLAMYYYSTERPADELRPVHNTLYKGLHVA
ncbi:2OG-Fe(II) oxygenase [Ahniella affigens]|nr:2OG-Fe(II) oxygenase [Ahniella affigens]